MPAVDRPHPDAVDGIDDRARLDGLTRDKLHQALNTRKSLRHIVLLTNAFTNAHNGGSGANSPTASFYSDVAVSGHSAYRQPPLLESEAEETRRKEQEWFDALLDGMIEAEDVEGEDGYVDVSFREPLDPQEQENDDGTAPLLDAGEALADSGWMEEKDYSAHTAFQIPALVPDGSPDTSTASLSLSDLPELTRDNDTPEASPELASLSVNDLQLIPYIAAPLLPLYKPARQAVDLAPPALASDSLAHALKALRLPIRIDLPAGWDLQDFGPCPAGAPDRPTRVLDDIYLSLPRRGSQRQRQQVKASILVQSLLLS